MADTVFPTISPTPVRDYRTFDFMAQLQQVPLGLELPEPKADVPDPSPLTPGATITKAVWTIALEPSPGMVDDPSYLLRLIGSPIISKFTTSHLVGDMVPGCVYMLTAQIETDDLRVFVKSGEQACMVQQEPVHPPIDAGVVVFDYDRFVSAFPAFVGINSDTLERMWITAGLIFRNNWSSPEWDLNTRAYLLALLTAHIAQLFAGPPGSAPGMYSTGMVGRINSKSVDGVSVSAEGFPGVNGTQAWYLTTQYGALFWKATAAYRTMHYVPGPQRFPQYGGFPMLPYSRRFFW